jgi:hypothetical protein
VSPGFIVEVHEVPVPGPKDVSVRLRVGSLGKVTGTSTGYTPPTGAPVGMMGLPALMSIGSLTFSAGPS